MENDEYIKHLMFLIQRSLAQHDLHLDHYTIKMVPDSFEVVDLTLQIGKGAETNFVLDPKPQEDEDFISFLHKSHGKK